MIDIIQFTEMIQDIRGKVNAQSQDHPINKVIVSPKEEHLVKKLKDSTGIILCANYPDCDTDIENSDKWNSENHCLVFLLEKVSAGDMTDQQELEHYALLQSTMEKVKSILMADNFSCEYAYQSPDRIRTEWEYGIYGGYNGLSIGFQLIDYDGVTD